ncbi:MAG: polysaccharide deacetylase family protein [Pseudomonadota bacterium]
MTLISRRHLVTGLSAFCAGQSIARPLAAQTTVPLILTRATHGRAEVALTFDDGPHPTLTPQLLDILAAYGARATFYVIGRNAARYPEILRRMAAEGHEIGNHTWSHPSLYGVSDGGVLAEIDRTNDAVRAAVGFDPQSIRPPYGNMYPRQSHMVFDARGMTTVLWSVDPLDWQRPGSGVVAGRIINGSHSGAVVLSHDIHGPTVRAMPAVLDGLRGRGYSMVQVSEIVDRGVWPAPGRLARI